jgi:hypothetical protein
MEDHPIMANGESVSTQKNRNEKMLRRDERTVDVVFVI